MVATRRSSGKFIDVELSDNGKELQEVIPIEEQRAAIALGTQESEEDEDPRNISSIGRTSSSNKEERD